MKLLLFGLALLTSACGPPVGREARSILRQHQTELDKAVLEVSRLAQPTCIKPTFGYDGCLHRVPEGSFVSISVNDLTLFYVPPTERRVMDEFRSVARGGGPRCPPSKYQTSYATELGEGWFSGPFFTEGRGLHNAMIRGRLPMLDVSKELELDLAPDQRRTALRAPVNSAGEFCLDTLPPGKHSIWINYDREPSGTRPYPKTELAQFELRPHDNLDLGLLEALPAKLPVESIEVTVILEDGSPVDGAGVAADSDYGETDGAGVAHVTVIPGKPHLVWAWKMRTRYWIVTRQWDARATIENARRVTLTLREHSP